MASIPLTEDLVLVLRRSKRGRRPPHLRKYQEMMGRAAPKCAERTKHLSGEERVRAYCSCIRELMKEMMEEGDV